MEGPSGTVTLLFSDIEGSTRMWDAHPADMQVALARHDVLLREAIEGANGYVFKTVGDAFCAAFPTAIEGLRAALRAQQTIGTEPWSAATPIRVRIGLHSGTCEERDGDYFGSVVNRTARLEALAHGGQTVLSGISAGLLEGALPDEVTLIDLGEHRLKDLGRPERVFQVRAPGTDDVFPPLRSLDNPALLHNLPAQVSTFVGRADEVGELRDLVDASRLVTVTGFGGAGKTRLALQVAADMLDGSGDGVWFIDLAPLADSELVAAAIGSVLGVREQAGRPVLEVLVDALAGQRCLLVLDNCEHVVDAAAKAAHAILVACPNVHLLATSREPLGIGGERVYRVPPLHVPAADETDPRVLAASDAVRLFAERVMQHQARYAPDPTTAATIARVCRRLDGLPLAIELAAARLRTVSLDELETRLDQRFRILTGGVRTALPRHQTLRALIDWSWDLLTEAERSVLVRVAVFAGGWDLDAAESVVARSDIETWEVLDLLGALVDKSLVQIDDTSGTVRYRLLESVREYASARLVEREEAAIAARHHRDHYLALAERAAPHLTTDRQTEWLDRLERDVDNLRGALVHSLADSDPEPGMRLAVAMYWLWQFRGPALEGAEVLTALLDRTDNQAPTAVRGRALAVLATLLIASGDAPAGSSRGDEPLAIARAVGDSNLEAHALYVHSWACLRIGNTRDALALADRGLPLARDTGDVDLCTRFLNSRGNAVGEQGDSSAALAAFKEARALCRQTGNRIRVAALLNNIGYYELAAGDVEAARADLGEALTISLETHDTCAINAMFNLGLVEYLHGAHPAARALFVRAFFAARRSGEQMQVAYAIFGLALTMDGSEPAATIHGGADSWFDELVETYERVEAEVRRLHQGRLQIELGVEDFRAAYERGRSLPREEVIALALEGSGKLA